MSDTDDNVQNFKQRCVECDYQRESSRSWYNFKHLFHNDKPKQK